MDSSPPTSPANRVPHTQVANPVSTSRSITADAPAHYRNARVPARRQEASGSPKPAPKPAVGANAATHLLGRRHCSALNRRAPGTRLRRSLYDPRHHEPDALRPLPGYCEGVVVILCRRVRGRDAAATFAEFSRTDGPADAVAHGYLVDAPIALSASDCCWGAAGLPCRGVNVPRCSAPPRPRQCAGGLRVWRRTGRWSDELEKRPWDTFDGQVIDRYGLHWLIGFKD